jgi:isoquinoline 1-oxidoreductase beta subunit
MWGLGHATADRIDIRHGQVEQKNFDTYRVMRMTDMPDVDIVVKQGDTSKPGGVGELSSPSVAPAVANAVFRLTGKRLRDTPFDLAKIGGKAINAVSRENAQMSENLDAPNWPDA